MEDKFKKMAAKKVSQFNLKNPLTFTALLLCHRSTLISINTFHDIFAANLCVANKNTQHLSFLNGLLA